MVKVIEMEYSSKRLEQPIILASGTYQGYNYYVLSMGTHPCGYIEIPETSKYYNVYCDNIPVNCHGGLTYSRNYLNSIAAEDEGRYFIGWDYAHYNDYVGYYDMVEFQPPFITSLLKHTSMEMVNDCCEVIEQLIELESQKGESL